MVTITSGSFAENVPKPVDDHVNDFAEVIDEYDKESIRATLNELKTQTDVEMVVVTIDSLPYQNSMLKFSRKLLHQWGVGKNSDDNGVLLLIVTEDNQVKVYTGRGYINRYDKTMKQIVDEQIMPEFSSGSFSSAALVGTNAIADAIIEKRVIVMFGLTWLYIILFIGIIALLITTIGWIIKGKPSGGWVMIYGALGTLWTKLSPEENEFGFGVYSSRDNSSSGDFGD